MKLQVLFASLMIGVGVVTAFAPSPLTLTQTLTSTQTQTSRNNNVILHASLEESLEKVKSTVQTSLRIFQESQADGADFKQSVANILAGEYDQDAIRAKIDDIINSAPCVMLTWENSPSCKTAVRAMDASGYEYSIFRLDDPWSEGNPIRAEVGKVVGRTSVPMVFIGGEYVGGYDGGSDAQDAPGLVDLAFRGILQSKLEAAGARRK